MRSIGVFLEFCLQVLFLSNKPAPSSDSRSSAAKSRPLRPPRLRSKRPRRSSAALCVVMVFSAIAQFLKRVCILVIGLFRLTYRKVSLLVTVEECSNEWGAECTCRWWIFNMRLIFQLMHTTHHRHHHTPIWIWCMLVLACCRLQNISLCGTTTALSHHSQRQDCVGQILIIMSLCNTSLRGYFFFNCTDSVRRKIMVLDLDETLIHSHHDGALTVTTPLTPPDFIVRVSQGR